MYNIFTMIIFLASHAGMAQINTLHATYEVTKIFELINSTQKNLILNYKGSYYQKANKSISFLEPQFLEQYPTGQIQLTSTNSSGQQFGICADTVQAICLTHHDSLLFRVQINYPGVGKYANNYFTYDKDAYEWKILDETREIDGLKCQRAQSYHRAMEPFIGMAGLP